ncbi:MAG: aldose 1-epimerase family protein [Eubacteriales bacterium]
MNYTIENEKIQLTINSIGAELISLQSRTTGQEYMWSGDPTYWGRTSPLLFPFIGGLQGGTYTYDGIAYKMAKHGFLRDAPFELVKQTQEELWFVTRSNEETLKSYPFAYELEVGYWLRGESVDVIWKIHNKGDKMMEYSIGGHPAFKCPLHENEERTAYSLQFKRKSTLEQTPVTKAGFAAQEPVTITLDQERIPLKDNIFAEDALIFENYQVSEISLVDSRNQPYIAMACDTPVLAVWSLAEKEAQFVCFEPWYGLCDVEGIHVPLQERKWMNHLQAGEVEVKQYTIHIL